MIYCSGLQARKRYIKSLFSRSNLPAIMDYGHSMQHPIYRRSENWERRPSRKEDMARKIIIPV
jgi:hypothetical protein